MYKKLLLFSVLVGYTHCAETSSMDSLVLLARSAPALTQALNTATQAFKNFNAQQTGLVFVGASVGYFSARQLFQDRAQQPENTPIYKRHWFIPACGLLGGTTLILLSKHIA